MIHYLIKQKGGMEWNVILGVGVTLNGRDICIGMAVLEDVGLG